MPSFTITINGTSRRVEADARMPLLWVLRDILGLTGTKYGCGAGLCGACTVHLDGNATRSCVTPASAAAGHQVTTIEGLSTFGDRIQQAWIAEQVPQCGYCQPGQIMTAFALLREKPKASDDDIDRAMSGNICRCGTYQRIRRAIARAVATNGEVKHATA